MRPIAIVQHEPSVPPGSIKQVLEEDDIEHFVFDAWNEREWPSADELGGLVVLGGTMNVDQLDDYPFLRKSRDLMSEAIERGLPTLGVCLGSQMMARVLGAEVFRASPRNALFCVIDAQEDDPVIRPFASGAPVLQFHEDTFAVPDDATLLATSAASGLAQAFRYGETAYAIQFHFEVDRDILQMWCDDIGDEALEREWLTSKDELLKQADRHVDDSYAAGRNVTRSFLETTTALHR